MEIHKNIMRHNSHSLTFLETHIVFCTKYRHKIMNEEIQSFLAHQFREIAKRNDCYINTLHVDVDHVHMLVEYPPKLSISQLAKRFKGASSREVRLQYPHLANRNFHSQKSFWSIGYFCCSVGEDAEERIRRYIISHTD